MSSRTAPATRGSASVMLLGVGAGTIAAAWLDINSFAAFVAVALAGAIYSLLAGSPLPLRVGAALSTLSFPFMVAGSGEAGLLWSCTIAFAILSFASIAGGLRRRLVPTLAIAFLVVTYLASLGAHLVLIKQLRGAGEMVGAFVLAAGGYEAASAAVERRLHGERRRRSLVPDWRAAGAGLLVCAGVIFAARSVLGLALGVPAVLILGLAVSLAAATGNAVGGLVAETLEERIGPGDVYALRHLNAVLLAAPAFYYGFRLYLT